MDEVARQARGAGLIGGGDTGNQAGVLTAVFFCIYNNHGLRVG